MDKYEVSNNKYRQFLEAVKSGQLDTGTPTTLKAAPTFTLDELKPDSTVWTKSFAYHYGDPLMEFYFDHPAFDAYPVVGFHTIRYKNIVNGEPTIYVRTTTSNLTCLHLDYLLRQSGSMLQRVEKKSPNTLGEVLMSRIKEVV